VKFDVPAAVGVPLMTPAELSDKPAGSLPAEMVQLSSPVPPLAANVCEYALPVVPPGSDDVVTDSAGFTAMLRALVALESPLTALTVKLNVPLAEGVPLIVPVAERPMPPGSDPALTVQM
jgi:hypothetical protein